MGLSKQKSSRKVSNRQDAMKGFKAKKVKYITFTCSYKWKTINLYFKRKSIIINIKSQESWNVSDMISLVVLILYSSYMVLLGSEYESMQLVEHPHLPKYLQ